METLPSAQSPPQKLNSGSSSQKARKSRCQTFLALSSLTGPLHPAPNTPPRIVDPHLRKSENFSGFESNILKLIRPSPNPALNRHNPREICLITRLRLGLSLLCSRGNVVESTEHFLLHCPQFVNERRILLSTSGNFNCILLENTSNVLTQTLLFGNTSLSPNDNSNTRVVTINFILLTKRFDGQLL